MTQTQTINLPDLFKLQDGQTVHTASEWQHRREELREALLQIEYGPLPPTPVGMDAEVLHSHTVASLENARHVQHRLTLGRVAGAQFILDVLIPGGDEPHPVILGGDGCWGHLADEIVMDVLHRGNVLAQFNRVEIAADNGRLDRTGVVRRLNPKQDFGVLAAWAWGYHRCVDFLQMLPFVDASRIAIIGHSRGGKAALLAGATDQRIALTAANGSGCGGAGCFRAQGPGSETLADILRNFPLWFGPRLREYIGRENSLPFDQHALAALVAPRPLLFTEALGDLWANPTGTWETFNAARKVYDFLIADQKIGIAYRPGGHEHNRQDWTTFLDFVDWHFRGQSPAAGSFAGNPFDKESDSEGIELI